MDLSYPKSVRLHLRKDLEDLFTGENVFYNSLFKVYYRKTEDIGYSRFAVTVPKKNFKRAVHRNLLKRRVKESIRLNRSFLPEGRNFDFLLVYRVNEINNYAQIEAMVRNVFKCSKLLEK
ncbi:MAG: ribonuclease P protein component [Bacteroidales bacterium]|nr:ribonuclease P protein component [Bacteroidales bacterium]